MRNIRFFLLFSGIIGLGLTLGGCVTDGNGLAQGARGVLQEFGGTLDSFFGVERNSAGSGEAPAPSIQHDTELGGNESTTQVAQANFTYVKPSIPPLKGPKKVVAVSRFENRASVEGGGAYKLGSGMADQLIDALVQSGHFLVLERQTLSDVIGEQDLAASGRVSKAKSARIGRLTVAQFLVKGTITEFTPNSSGTGQAVNFMGLSVGSDKGVSHVGLIIRLIDTTTGVVVASKSPSGKFMKDNNAG